MTSHNSHPLRAACVAAALLGLLSGTAHADSGSLSPRQRAARLPAGMRHLPPGLPARPAAGQFVAPHHVRAGPHYGSDASLDAARRSRSAPGCKPMPARYKRVEQRAAAGPHHPLGLVRAQAPQDRPAVWQHASVKSPANCAACHTGAAQGDFDDDRLRMPPGLDKRYQNAFKDD